MPSPCRLVYQLTPQWSWPRTLSHRLSADNSCRLALPSSSTKCPTCRISDFDELLLACASIELTHCLSLNFAILLLLAPLNCCTACQLTRKCSWHRSLICKLSADNLCWLVVNYPSHLHCNLFRWLSVCVCAHRTDALDCLLLPAKHFACCSLLELMMIFVLANALINRINLPSSILACYNFYIFPWWLPAPRAPIKLTHVFIN